jgi:hypothetical protein
MTTTDRRPTRRSHPAVSARILALGLSTMATFGMVAGYSLAEARTIPDEPQPLVAPASPVVGDPPAEVTAPVVTGSVAPSSGSSAPKASAAKPSTTAKAPRTIQVPVPAVPATSGGNTQNSSGSN